jgi:hypothetical protein
MTERVFYHYTCADGVAGIHRDGIIRPNAHPLLCEELVWLTDMEVPVRAALGLTSHTLTCDRTEYRVTVRTNQAVWWPIYARRVDPAVRREFEFALGAMPAHWWVSPKALKASGVRASNKAGLFR